MFKFGYDKYGNIVKLEDPVEIMHINIANFSSIYPTKCEFCPYTIPEYSNEYFYSLDTRLQSYRICKECKNLAVDTVKSGRIYIYWLIQQFYLNKDITNSIGALRFSHNHVVEKYWSNIVARFPWNK